MKPFLVFVWGGEEGFTGEDCADFFEGEEAADFSGGGGFGFRGLRGGEAAEPGAVDCCADGVLH